MRRRSIQVRVDSSRTSIVSTPSSLGAIHVFALDWRRRLMPTFPFIPSFLMATAHVSAAYLRAIDATASPTDSRLEPTPDDLAAAARALDRIERRPLAPGRDFSRQRKSREELAGGEVRGARIDIVEARQRCRHSWTGGIVAGADLSRAWRRGSQGPRFADRRGDRAARGGLRRQRFGRVASGGGGRHVRAWRYSGQPTLRDGVHFGGGRIDILRRDPIDSIEVEEVAGALSKFVA